MALESTPHLSGGDFFQDIEYANGGGESLRLDVHAPTGNGPFPMAILVHGGGWSGGDKADDDIKILTPPLLAAGFVCVSINYRLAPKHRWPAPLEDVQAALRWIAGHAPQLQGDPQRSALIGYSAGGQLACLATVLADETMRVQAVVGIAAPTDMVADMERRGGLSPAAKDLIRRETFSDQERAILHGMSPLNFVKPGLPPFLLLHGTADQSVPYEQSLRFREKLLAADVPCELVTLQNAPHRLSQWSAFDANFANKMTGWLALALNLNGK